MPSAAVDILSRAYNNYTMLLLSVTELVVAPPGALTQTKVQAVVAAAGVLGILIPQINSSVDGESYDWVGFQTFIIDKMETLERAIQRAGGPFEKITQCWT